MWGHVRVWTGGLLAVAVVVALGAVVVRDAGALRDVAWTFRPGRLLAATAVEIALLVASVGLWGRVLARFDATRPPFGALLRVWVRGTLAKYLPGTIWPVVSTATQASRIGASPLALAASFVLHGLFTALGALVVAAALVGVPPQVALGLLATAVPLVHPALLNGALGAASRWTGRPVPQWKGRWVDGVGLVALHAVTWLGYGLGFVLFASALLPVEAAAWPHLVGAHALSFVAGFVAVFAPGGLGVREAALVGLLVPTVPASVAVALAAGSRLWLLSTELLVGVLTVAWGGTGRMALQTEAPRTVARSPVTPALPGISPGNDVEPLLDSATALGRIATSCRSARRSVRLAQLAFDVDCRSAAGVDGPDDHLVDALAAAAAAGAVVRVLLNGSILMNTVPALQKHFAALGSPVEVRGVSAFPTLLHAKLVLVDDAEAFLVGSPFVNGYWDDGAHRPADPRRTEEDLAGRPIHDLSVRLTGPAVADLAAWFDALWEGEPERPEVPLPRRLAPPPPPPDAASVEPSGTSVRVLTTHPAGLSPRHPDGCTEILGAYLDAIASARSLLYLENQYFSSRPIRAALVEALAARPELEVILVLNQNPDITAYRTWQDHRLAEGGLLHHPRVGVFSLWAAAASLAPPHRPEITQLFIHSKVAVVDDCWATVGTANLDGVSLATYGDDFSSPLLRRVFRSVRNVDLNLALLDGADGEPPSGVVANLRQTLWARHLGLDAGTLAERPDGGWLPLWRDRAAHHASQLAAGAVPDGHVLPFASRSRPRTQLGALGVDVEAAGLDLRFDPSWVEVLWSPGWLLKTIPEPVRKRFARPRPSSPPP